MFIGLSIPIIFLLVVVADRQQAQSDEKVRMLTAELTEALGAAATEAGIRDVQVQRQEFESRLANALDMAGGEPEVIDVIQRSFSTVLPRGAVELLLADNSHAHLTRMTGVAPEGERDAVVHGRLARSVPGRPAGADSGLLGQRRSRCLPEAAQPAPGRNSQPCAFRSRSWVAPSV